MNESEKYNKEKLTIDLLWANKFGLLILFPIVVVFGLPYYLVWRSELDFKDMLGGLGLSGSFYVFGIILLGIAVHELIHGIAWAIFAKNGFKSMKFGVMWKLLTPYCHCKDALKVKEYIIGAIAPAILLGILPAIVAIFNGSISLLIFGMFFTMAACGDFLIINLIRKENWDDLVEDHPTEAGCYIYRKISN
ncbi:DUF3267 domain-containing protein [Sphingobacterium siyangense]|uniref:DUF3267 domain-containing protein n=1 Tax=Sphingobacterium siyangense TaxID=459529 RepID=UPI002FD9C637